MKNILLILSFIWIVAAILNMAYAQNKTEFNFDFEGVRWESFVVDSSFLNVYDVSRSLDSIGLVREYDPELEDSIWVSIHYYSYIYLLTKRGDNTYNHWKLINGKLQPVYLYKNAQPFKPQKRTVME